jgi:hypothetical protein
MVAGYVDGEPGARVVAGIPTTPKVLNIARQTARFRAGHP